MSKIFDELLKNCPSISNKIPNVNMDTKMNGGIHLWIKGTFVKKLPFLSENRKELFSISTHLSKKEAIMLAGEILFRIIKFEREENEEILNSLWKNFLTESDE